MSRVIISLVFSFVGMPVIALAQPVTVVNHMSPELESGVYWESDSFEYVDIPGTEQMVTIPPGIAIINWGLYAELSGGRIRAVIGSETATIGVPVLPHMGGWVSGSWSTATQGGTIPVKLQVALTDTVENVNSERFTFQKQATWTLVVFPDQVQGAPAVGGTGLALMVALAAVAGAVVFRRTSPPSITRP